MADVAAAYTVKNNAWFSPKSGSDNTLQICLGSIGNQAENGLEWKPISRSRCLSLHCEPVSGAHCMVIRGLMGTNFSFSLLRTIFWCPLLVNISCHFIMGDVSFHFITLEVIHISVFWQCRNMCHIFAFSDALMKIIFRRYLTYGINEFIILEAGKYNLGFW